MSTVNKLSNQNIDNLVKAYLEYKHADEVTKALKQEFDDMKKKYIVNRSVPDGVYYSEKGKVKVTRSCRHTFDSNSFRKDHPKMAEKYDCIQENITITVTNLEAPTDDRSMLKL